MASNDRVQLPFAIDDTPFVDSVSASPAPNSIVCGDSREVMREITDESVRLVVTSPPYWNLVDYGYPQQIGQSSYEAYLKDLADVWEECERVLVPNGKLCINTPIVPVPKEQSPKDQHTREIKNLNNDIEALLLSRTRLQRYSLYLWQKQTTVKMFGSYPYPPNIYENNTIEFINVLVKPGAPAKLDISVKDANRIAQEEWLDLTRQIWWIYPEDVSRTGRHPTPFPELLPARLIKMFSFGAVPEVGFEGDVILDPFGGVGTTALAAKTLGRRYISVDVSTEFTSRAAQDVALRSENRALDVKLRRLSDADRNRPVQYQLGIDG